MNIAVAIFIFYCLFYCVITAAIINTMEETMKKSMLVAGLVVVLALFFGLNLFAQADKAQYIGAAKCKMCHTAKAKGEAYTIWANSPHAKAYATLATEEAKAVGKKAGVEDPQKSAKCLKCHVTAYDAAATAKAATYKMEDGVTCETCHGAGSLYQSMKVMKALTAGTQDKAAVGYNSGDKKACVKCHNQESPTYKPFKAEEAFKIIAHPAPKS
jgi:hypothetical protein